jgi:hypothetical protein
VNPALEWLLDGDVAVQYLAHRDLLASGPLVLAPLQARIPGEGFGARYLACRNASGHWGKTWYQPKWTCTHYSLLDMKNLGMPRDMPACAQMVRRMFRERGRDDGSVNFATTAIPSDVCINGMALSHATWFRADVGDLERLVDYLLGVQMPDGGFSWSHFKPHAQSEPHSTVAVLEGLRDFAAEHDHRRDDIGGALMAAREYLLDRALFAFPDERQFDRRFLALSFPYRYRYDCLRGLEALARWGVPYDSRMERALSWLAGKRRDDGRWLLERVHPGQVHFEMEHPRAPGRFVTLAAMLVGQRYGQDA